MGADLEAGMYYGGGWETTLNERNKPLPHEVVTAYLRGRTDGFMLKGDDANQGTLTTMYTMAHGRDLSTVLSLNGRLTGHGVIS